MASPEEDAIGRAVWNANHMTTFNADGTPEGGRRGNEGNKGGNGCLVGGLLFILGVVTGIVIDEHKSEIPLIHPSGEPTIQTTHTPPTIPPPHNITVTPGK